jgi:2-dehydro-3-deoxyphosphogluconate aldolase/(4S)-4-hydroxy-2-oxoglutarate aldolase
MTSSEPRPSGTDPAVAALDRLEAAKVVAVVRVSVPDGVVAACRALCRHGIGAVEITLTVPGAAELITALVAEFAGDLLVGAGTVLDAGAARRSVEAGAQFVVSPVFDAAVVDQCRAAGVLAVPAALTPTEVLAAWQHGARLVKLFPARVATPAYVRDLLGPLPGVRLFPTGGIDEAGAAAYFEAGAAAVGIGSALMPPDAIARGDTDTIAAAATRFARVAAQAQDAQRERRR